GCVGATTLEFRRRPVGLEVSTRVRMSFGNGTSGNGLRVRSKTIRGPPVCWAGARPSKGSALRQAASALARQQAMGRRLFDMAIGRGRVTPVQKESVARSLVAVTPARAEPSARRKALPGK